MKTKTPLFLLKQIKTPGDCMRYVVNLYDNSLLYHFDDDALDCFDNKNLAKLINNRTKECYEVLGQTNFEAMFMWAMTFLEPEMIAETYNLK